MQDDDLGVLAASFNLFQGEGVTVTVFFADIRNLTR